MRVELRPRPLDRLARTDAERDARRRVSVALVSMPFAVHTYPSLQIGLLKARAEQYGFTATTYHLMLELAVTVNSELYGLLSQHRGYALGDWLFSTAAFREGAPDPDATLLDVLADELTELKVAGEPVSAAELRRVRDEIVPDFLDRMVDAHPWGDFTVVGFTSTFQQNAASFALARRIKERHPEVLILFGGANFEGDMGREHLRSVPWIDHAIDGEADVAFPAFLAALADGRDPATVPGVLSRRGGEVVGTTSEPFDALDDLPIPDYTEFFSRAEALGLLAPGARREVRLPYESARGCWWGAKRHCTFCGLNGTTMGFRAKAAERVLGEIAVLAQRHRSFHFVAVDNILEPTYLDTLLPMIRRHGLTYQMFYEVKSNLTKAQLRTMRDAGVTDIQPGIESLSSHVLTLMRKGVKASQNVAVMKWSKYLGITVGWNLLHGFPHEVLADYEEQERLIPHLVHLDAPRGSGRIWMERFSPVYREHDEFPHVFLRPERSLSYIYPAHYDLERSAYFFDYELEDTLPDEAYAGVAKVVADWQAAEASTERTPTLRYWSSPGFLQIEDHRWPDRVGTYTFDSPLADLYLAADEKPVTARHIKERHQLPNPVEEIEEALDEFTARGLMMRDGNLFLGLAMPATGGAP